MCTLRRRFLFNSAAKNKFTICTLHQISRVHEGDFHYTSICCAFRHDVKQWKKNRAHCCLLKSLQFPLIFLGSFFSLVLHSLATLLSFLRMFTARPVVVARFNLSSASCARSSGSWRSQSESIVTERDGSKVSSEKIRENPFRNVLKP